jgi:hypothetical protein
MAAQPKGRSTAQSSPTTLPLLVDKGRRLPYIRYVTSDVDSRNGKVFFLYPMMSRRNDVLALDYSPYEQITDLFAEDMIGISGPTTIKNGMLAIDFLPISLPVGVTGGREWSLRYAKQDFICRSSQDQEPKDLLIINCVTLKYTLSFSFNRTRGVLSYQDFCGSAICTYKLIEQQGLLSKGVLEHMGLPKL